MFKNNYDESQLWINSFIFIAVIFKVFLHESYKITDCDMNFHLHNYFWDGETNFKKATNILIENIAVKEMTQ